MSGPSDDHGTGLMVNCPRCRQQTPWSATENPYRPFCSQRCREIDLGHWADESYRVEAVEEINDDRFDH